MPWKKKWVYVVTIWFDDPEEEGWYSSDSENYYADTWEEAVKMKEKFLSGEDEWYGDDIWACDISDAPVEEEVWISDKEKGGRKK